MMNRTRSRGPSGGRDVGAELAQLRRPDVGVAALVAGDPLEGGRAARVLLDRRQRVVQDDRVAFQLEVVEALLDVDGGHARHRRPSSARVDSRAMSRAPAPGPSPLRYLSAADVLAAMPDHRRAPGARRADDDRARRGCRAAAQDRRPPAPAGSFAHAMPAYLRGADAGRRGRPARHEVGRRVSPTNNERGLPAINAVVVLNDPTTGRAGRDPRRRADHRAADRGRLGRRDPPLRPGRRRGRAPRAALIGAGVQGHSHLAVLGRVLPGVELTLFDRHPDRAAALADGGRGDRRDR